NYQLGVKLVRGAYMEKERERAQTLGYQDPIQIDKDAADEYFNKGLKFCIEHLNKIALFCGSHNEYSNRYLTELMGNYNIRPDDPRIFFSQLYGMSDNISFNLSNAGYNVIKYLPYGPVNDVIPYLFRRAEENTSIAGQSSREYVLIKKELARRRANTT
ncbi:MAG: proline dehydrogenase, partial [Bacteroidetes bacterium]